MVTHDSNVAKYSDITVNICDGKSHQKIIIQSKGEKTMKKTQLFTSIILAIIMIIAPQTFALASDDMPKAARLQA